MKKVFVIIDGSNLYYKLKQTGVKNLLLFDYLAFIKWLTKTPKFQAIYYVGRIREESNNPKSKELKKSQDKLISGLENQGIQVKTGYILKSDEAYHEKGVDVQMAVDICMKAVRKEYERLVLISSDTDLIPAIKEAKSLRKTIEYVGFDTQPSFALIRFSDHQTLLKLEDLKQFVKP